MKVCGIMNKNIKGAVKLKPLETAINKCQTFIERRRAAKVLSKEKDSDEDKNKKVK